MTLLLQGRTVGPTPRRTRVIRLLEFLVGLLLGGAVLCLAAERSGPRHGTAFVHVTEPDVVVAVGGREYPVEGRRYRPLRCDLPPGRHRLTMRRGDELLFDEPFEIGRGEEVVLAAWAARGIGS